MRLSIHPAAMDPGVLRVGGLAAWRAGALVAEDKHPKGLSSLLTRRRNDPIAVLIRTVLECTDDLLHRFAGRLRFVVPGPAGGSPGRGDLLPCARGLSRMHAGGAQLRLLVGHRGLYAIH